MQATIERYRRHAKDNQINNKSIIEQNMQVVLPSEYTDAISTLNLLEYNEYAKYCLTTYPKEIDSWNFLAFHLFFSSSFSPK